MTDLERAQKIIEQYIRTLTWSPAATDDDITLVHGNVRGMASTIAAALAAVREEDAQVVDDEPELPGDVSAAVKYHIARFGDDGIKEVCRAVVRATKKNIAAAIREKGRM